MGRAIAYILNASRNSRLYLQLKSQPINQGTTGSQKYPRIFIVGDFILFTLFSPACPIVNYVFVCFSLLYHILIIFRKCAIKIVDLFPRAFIQFFILYYHIHSFSLCNYIGNLIEDRDVSLACFSTHHCFGDHFISIY